MAYIGWAVNVNKEILSSTNVTVGEGAVVSDTLETGGIKKSRLVNGNPPDKFSVTMEFGFTDESKDQNGYTEVERFWRWLKFSHCYGVNPFSFPAILINSNHQAGFSQEDYEHILKRIENGDPTAKLPDLEYYAITSAVNGEKSGVKQKITMTWETRATGVISVPDEVLIINRIDAQNGEVEILLSAIPSTEPTIQTWKLYVTPPEGTEAEEQVTNFYYNGTEKAILFFEKKTVVGVYTVRVENETDTFEVES